MREQGCSLHDILIPCRVESIGDCLIYLQRRDLFRKNRLTYSLEDLKCLRICLTTCRAGRVSFKCSINK